MGIKLQSSGGGSVELVAPSTGSTIQLTMPTASGNIVTTDSSGNVGIGTSSPSSKLHVQDASAPTIQLSDGAGRNVKLSSGTSSSAPALGTYYSQDFLFYTNSTERARIDSSGSLNVGGTGANNGGAILHAERSTSAVVGRFFATASSGYASDVLQAISNQGSNTSSTIFGAYYSGGATFAFRVRGDGKIYAQDTTVQSASDARFKENIVNATEGLDVVSALRPVRFDIKEGHGVSAKQNQLGFIAQEVQAVFPDAVDVWKESDDPENPYLSLGSTALIPVLVKAIQEQQALITQQAATIADLVARVTALENK
jgi:hypothetical protein